MSKIKIAYNRIAVFPLEAILPFVFTNVKRHELKVQGYKYTDIEWINASKKVYTVLSKKYTVKMGSHRYQLFVLKGTNCVKCGIEGEFFALEQAAKDNTPNFHFNLYGLDKYSNEIMITKDHVIPRSQGGKNVLSNYQPLCYSCNQDKADNVEN